ncbi:MAG: ferrous iron transport protein A [Methanomassiliicoccales archaeon]
MLSEIRPGRVARVIGIEGGTGLKQSLKLRGLAEGRVIRMISNSGPITVEVDRSMICLGRGMAEKVRIAEL